MILNWFVQLCFAVKYIHEKYILHRDLKLSNIFLCSTGEIKLGDFGTSKLLSGTDHYADSTVGTPYYLSPEICKKNQYREKSDIWSMGCVLYELMSLKHAFEADSNKLLNEN
jgi:NIMA (never in mitosis gene a)-related kinase